MGRKSKQNNMPLVFIIFLSNLATNGGHVVKVSAQDTAYAVVYTAKVSPSLNGSIEDIETIARNVGSKEVITFTADRGPCNAIMRVLESFGDPAFAYPGFSACPYQLLDEQTKLGNVASVVSEDVQVSNLEFQGVQLRITWLLPQDNEAPLIVKYTAADQELIRVTVTSTPGVLEPRSRPRVIRTTGIAGSEIVQVFDYFQDSPLNARILSAPDQNEPVLLDQIEFSPGQSQGGVAGVTTRHANFCFPEIGIGNVILDSGWQPGGSQGAAPIQIHIRAAIGGDIVAARVEGDVNLNDQTSRLQLGSGSGQVCIGPLGAEFVVQAYLCLNLPFPLPDICGKFDIPFVPSFDLIIDSCTSFSSFALDTCPQASDSAMGTIFDVGICGVLCAAFPAVCPFLHYY